MRISRISPKLSRFESACSVLPSDTLVEASGPVWPQVTWIGHPPPLACFTLLAVYLVTSAAFPAAADLHDSSSRRSLLQATSSKSLPSYLKQQSAPSCSVRRCALYFRQYPAISCSATAGVSPTSNSMEPNRNLSAGVFEPAAERTSALLPRTQDFSSLISS